MIGGRTASWRCSQLEENVKLDKVRFDSEEMSDICFFFFPDNMAYRYIGLIFAVLSVLQKNRRPFFGKDERGLISRKVVIESNR